MKNRLSFGVILISILLIFKSSFASAQTDTVQIGIYVTSVHNINFKDLEYGISFWLWLKYKNKKRNYLKTLEIPNAKTIDKVFKIDYSTDSLAYFMVKIQALMKDSWEINKFPFDKQTLLLTVENSKYETDSLVFINDVTNAPFDTSMVRTSMRGWTVDSVVVSLDSSSYQTTFGDTSLKAPLHYSRLGTKISISRDNPIKIFMKLFLGMYIAFFISIICFYIQPDNFESRFQLAVGALFAVIGNKYIVESALPESASSTLVDSLHNLTLFFIMLSILATIISLRLSQGEKRKNVRRFDIWVSEILLVVYIICNLIFIFF